MYTASYCALYRSTARASSRAALDVSCKTSFNTSVGFSFTCIDYLSLVMVKSGFTKASGGFAHG
jgi:hypothetical protein